jgi:two-component system chemotaxis response regulator CheY
MPSAKPRVLVVDDDLVIRESISALLVDEGYDVREAANGRQALATIEEWLPDLILLDLMMPIMDGWTFRDRQRDIEAARHIPVIVLSATHNLGQRANGLDAAAVFPKPFDLDELLDTVEQVTAPGL